METQENSEKKAQRRRRVVHRKQFNCFLPDLNGCRLAGSQITFSQKSAPPKPSFPKRYNFKEIEPKWQKFWEKTGIYRFCKSDYSRPAYSIDTPPPYPSGELHVGNALNFSYIDFIARYKRLKGYNVFFPQGWDCHGLPTEVRLERTLGKRKTEFTPEEFVKLAREYTLKWIEPMRKALKALGLSIDWSTEYVTMDPDYWRRTQYSFIVMWKKGLVYRGEHPVLWCPRCETAIAEAEVEYVEKRRLLYFFKFKLVDGGYITVASTRPELLASCVALAVNPSDERYSHLVGKKATVPIYGREVPIIADEEVDPEFGTGVVMICTYGDKTDVKWQKRHSLPVIVSIDEKGHMNENAGVLKGLPVAEAKKKIAEILKERGLLVKVEETLSSIGTCWRCHTPVEIIPKKQWFVKTRELASKVLEEAEKIKWIPEHAKKILENWVKSLDWDWVISRQRYFGTPFPVYYCSKCGYTIVVEPEHLPIDLRKDPCPVEKCPRCGSREFTGEKDVMDTWMDSSITAAVHAGWPDELDERLFPADLQPNGFDIIRTWDYYLLVRGIALFNKTQYKTALINGMMRGTDGRMMHKSYGNYVSLLEVVEKYGADAFRIWVALAAATGSDLKFSWQGLDYAKRFLTKVWNAARLAYLFTKDYKPSQKIPPGQLKEVDNWILREFSKTIKQVEESLENFDFQTAVVKLIDFTWHKLCDHYLEIIKYRLASSTEAKYTLYTIILNLLKILSVFAPHISEELYHRLYREKENWISITVAPWPKPPEYSEEKARIGDIAVAVTAELRRLKHDKRIPLSKEIESATINPGKYCTELEKCLEDIKNTLHIKKIIFDEKLTEGRKVENYPEIIVSL